MMANIEVGERIAAIGAGAVGCYFGGMPAGGVARNADRPPCNLDSRRTNPQKYAVQIA
jgi:hypothetical protein